MQDVPKFVVNRLQRISPSEAHPDADLLAAFTEHSLAGRERTDLVDHLSRCAHCREVIALALPEYDANTLPGALKSPSSAVSRGWFGWPAVRWGVVAAGFALIASLGILQYQHRHQPGSALTANVSTPVENKTGNQNDQSIVTAPASQSHESATPLQAAAPTKQSEFPKKKTLPAARLTAMQARPVEIASNLQSPSEVGLSQNRAGTSQASANFDASKADVSKAKDPVQSQSAPTLSAPPAIPFQTSPALMSRASPRWSVSSDGVLQRSFDAGKTWEIVTVNAASPMAGNGDKPSDSTPAFRAVAAVGPEVWAGGVAATLYHSVDSGMHWMKLLPTSNGAVLTGDISLIEFSDPQHGRIATSIPEVWTTANGGQTWFKEQ